MVACRCGLTGGCQYCRPLSPTRIVPGQFYFWPSHPPAVPQGWQCPKCGNVHAPSVQTCPTCIAMPRIGPAIGVSGYTSPEPT